MIQDIIPYQYDNTYEDRVPREGDLVFIFSDRKILVRKNDRGEISVPEAQACRSADLTYLFSIDDRAFFLGGECEIEGFEYEDVLILRKLLPKVLCFAGATALHLYEWYRDNRFCGRCGGQLVKGKKERVLRCPACGNAVYPKIAPAVIVGVCDGDRILMTRYVPSTEHRGAGNALVAGFCEIGETAEETVRREVMEEVGLHVKNIRYFASQPWGFASNLLLGYYCDVDGSRQIRLDDQELARARWVSREEIGQEPENLSLTATMIMHFKRMVPSGDPDDLTNRIRALWKNHLPGLFSDNARASAVIIPLIRKEDGYHILFEKRAVDLDRQPGEICFPGGRVEEGESPQTTAIRETCEELLIQEDQIEILAGLSPQTGPNGAPVWPFAALLTGYENTWSEEEVDHVFTVPVSWFLENQPEDHMTRLVTMPDEDFPYDLIPGGKDYPWSRKEHRVLFYRNPHAVIWGLTARMTDDFIRNAFRDL